MYMKGGLPLLGVYERRNVLIRLSMKGGLPFLDVYDWRSALIRLYERRNALIRCI
jgi:hypothetical protein